MGNRRPLEDRFWPKVAKRAPHECWLWTGAKRRFGYGVIAEGGRHGRGLVAHRVSWEIANGRPVPNGLVVMHSCDNPSCVNPAHLSVGTTADNVRDCRAKGRNGYSNRTHCPQGHPYDEKNTYVRWGKHRVCRTCVRAAANAWEKRHRRVAHGKRVPREGFAESAQ